MLAWENHLVPQSKMLKPASQKGSHKLMENDLIHGPYTSFKTDLNQNLWTSFSFFLVTGTFMKGLFELITTICCVCYCIHKNTHYFLCNTINNSALNPKHTVNSPHPWSWNNVIHKTEQSIQGDCLSDNFSQKERGSPWAGLWFSFHSSILLFYLWPLFAFLSTCDAPRRQRRLSAGLESSPPPPPLQKKGQLHKDDIAHH